MPLFANTAKTAWDIGKTMSYVGKIMSDIIQTTSDLFSSFSNRWKTTTYGISLKEGNLLQINVLWISCSFAKHKAII